MSLSRYDAGVFTERLELRVGKDLQYVRISGTGIGCILGLIIYALDSLADSFVGAPG